MTEQTTTEPYLTVDDLARHYNRSDKTIRRWVARGCPHRQAGKWSVIQFVLSEVDAWLAEGGAS